MKPGLKVLHVVHDFLPRSVAGVEVYTDRLARAQRAAGGESAVAYPVRRTSAETGGGAIESGEVDGLPIFEIGLGEPARVFEDGYRPAALSKSMDALLDAAGPDVVHVQHLMNGSIDWVTSAAARGVPIVMTLHDHWLACAAGGQRHHPRLGRCETLDAVRCAGCTAHLHGLALRVSGRLRPTRVRERVGRGGRPSASVAALSRVRQLGRRALLAGHALTSSSGGRQVARIEARWRAMRGMAEGVGAFVAPSRHLAETMRQFGLPADRLHVIAHGFDPGPFAAHPPLPDRARRFGYLGSLVPHKGVDRLIDAFEGLPTDVTLDVYGSLEVFPSHASALRRRARHPGIRFHGELSPDRVPRMLAGLDCLVAPATWWENSPLTIQEAFLAGVPVIATDIGGQSELLAEGGGLRVPVDDVDALRAALSRTIEEDGLLRSLGASIPPVKTLEAHVDELDRLYRSLTAMSC